jgi:hypothetical protein
MGSFSLLHAKEYVLFVMLASLLSGLFPCSATFAQVTPPSKEPEITQPSAKNLEKWRAARRLFPPTAEGCFASSYPNEGWQQVPCSTAPPVPYPAALSHGTNNVGNGNDASAVASPAPLIWSAVGSFDNVSGVTSESGNVFGNPPAVANTFALQLNTQRYGSPLCQGANCQAWQQFIYSNSSCHPTPTACIFMQYWLINYEGTPAQPCPDNSWNYNAPGGNGAPGCWKNGASVLIPTQTIQQLGEMSLNGNAISGGWDTVLFYVGNAGYFVSGTDSMLNLGANWTWAEFNVVGDCCSSEANFDTGSTATIVVRTAISTGSPTQPSCLMTGTNGTAEYNNLYFVKASTTPPSSGTLPALVFTESSVQSSTPPCATPGISGPFAAAPVPASTPAQVPQEIYTYCIGDFYAVTPQLGCNSVQKLWDCSHNSQDQLTGEELCKADNYTFYKTWRTVNPLGGGNCGFTYGVMLCTNSDTPDRLCSLNDARFGCGDGPVQ